MKNLLTIAILALLLSSCASVPLTSKNDPAYTKQICSIHIMAQPMNDKEGTMYEKIILELKSSFAVRGVLVKEDYTEDPTPFDPTFRADALLILGKNEQQQNQVAVHVPLPRHSPSAWRSAMIPMDVPKTNRFMIVVKDATSSKTVWVATASSGSTEIRFLARKIVQQLEMDGLIPATMTAE